MRSVRESAHQYLRLTPPLSIRTVAGSLGLRPRSTQDLLNRLDQEQVTYNSGSLTPSSVKGSASLTLCSDGHWAFTGHVHENSFVRHEYVLSAASNQFDSTGAVFAFMHEGSVSDKRDQDFTDFGHDIRISQNWEALKQGKVTFYLKVDITAGTMLKMLGQIFAPVIIAGALLWIFHSSIGLSQDPETGKISRKDQE